MGVFLVVWVCFASENLVIGGECSVIGDGHDVLLEVMAGVEGWVVEVLWGFMIRLLCVLWRKFLKCWRTRCLHVIEIESFCVL